ncbi:MAG: transglycosylase domain-containing protein [Clostridia bacterium]|nr:transglycosylase domain-containing protein [Clostridia bacterium]
MNNFDGKDLYSFDNSANKIENGETSFDLNDFSSHTAEETEVVKEKKQKKQDRKQRIIKIVLTVFLVGLITVSLVVGAFMFYAFTMVDPTMDEDLNNLALDFTTTIYVDDGDGDYKEYRRLHSQFNRIWVDYDEESAKEKDPSYTGIPYNLAMAFVAIEDKGFNDHNGVDWKRTFAAFVNEFLPISNSRFGGSTITQQLVKNLTDDRSQKASRKVREIMRARYLEDNYAKATILECYLNTIPMGNGTYGVEVAANYYFGKRVKDLTIAECASLASITKAPTYYSPDKNPEENKLRRDVVLREMYSQGYITEEEYEKAVDSELVVTADKSVLNQNEVNSYFIDALINQVSSDLSEKYGYDKSHADQMFYNGGYKIYATVDVEMQEAAEKVFADEAYNIKNKNGDVLQAGITIMDYEGRVKAMVGSLGEKTDNRGWNNAIDAVRQPGSTMKPIAAYAPAIEQDLIHFSSILNDTKTNYNGWTPVNWYGSYWGNVTTQYALERSINAIPVYLVNKLKPKNSYDFLTQKLGITTLNEEDINLSPLGMGGTNGGLNTLESAAAFAIFGNGGRYYEPTFYTKVTNQDGKIILEHKTNSKMAISEDTATIMNHLLQTVVYGSNGTGKGAAGYISNMKIYAKTGTSNDQNDLWFVGGTPYYVGSCWCGYKTMQPIAKSYSGIAMKLWGNVMSKAHSGLAAKEFEDSPYAVEKYYCKTSGDIANSGCPDKAVGWYKTSNLDPKNKSYIPICTAHEGDAISDPGTEPDTDTSSNTSSND